MGHEELVERLRKFLPNIISHGQAESCGWHYIAFIPSSELELVSILQGLHYAHGNMSVNLQKFKLVYTLHVPMTRFDLLIDYLEENDRIVIEMTHMPIEQVKKIMDSFCNKCYHNLSYCGCKHGT